MLLRPCEVSRMTSGGTPISFPTLAARGPQYGILIDAGVEWCCLRMPMLFNSRRRVDDGPIHIEEESLKGHPYGRACEDHLGRTFWVYRHREWS